MKSRIAELIKENREHDEELRQKILEERKILAFSNIVDYINEDGTIDLSNLDKLKGACIKEYIIEEIGDNLTRIKIKLYDKDHSLKALERFLGMDQQLIDITSGGEKLPNKIEIELVGAKE